MRALRVLPLACAALVAASCAVHRGARSERQPEGRRETRERVIPLGYSVQVGAFTETRNAARLVEVLESLGLETFHFKDTDGLHKVRFGSFEERAAAAARAEALREERVIDAYYVVAPQREALEGNRALLRARVAGAARRFIGRPYEWGGDDTTVDCSGLAMAAYRLNGIDLPRTSLDQYTAGTAVDREALREADLVFFSTGRNRRPTHVGLYLGDGRFIHAPRRGKVVRIDSLSDRYYRERFLAARTYL